MPETDRDVLFHVFGAVVKDVVILGGTVDCVSILRAVSGLYNGGQSDLERRVTFVLAEMVSGSSIPRVALLTIPVSDVSPSDSVGSRPMLVLKIESRLSSSCSSAANQVASLAV